MTSEDYSKNPLVSYFSVDKLVSGCHFVIVSSYLVGYLQRNSSFTLGCLQISELLLFPFHRKDDFMINLNQVHLE